MENLRASRAAFTQNQLDDLATRENVTVLQHDDFECWSMDRVRECIKRIDIITKTCVDQASVTSAIEYELSTNERFVEFAHDYSHMFERLSNITFLRNERARRMLSQMLTAKEMEQSGQIDTDAAQRKVMSIVTEPED